MFTAKELGERRIIELLLAKYRRAPNMAVPFGDDVAGIYLNDDQIAVLKTDVLVGITDIPTRMSLKQASRKAIVMNISDFAAKGVKPLAILVALTIPKTYSQRDIEEIAEGLNTGAEEYDTYIIGGDTGEGSDLTISCMVFGVINPNQIILRRGAEIGDILAVTGFFGRTSAGLKILLEGLAAPDIIKKSLLESVLTPKARLLEGLALAQTGVITSAIDSSDGLAICLHELQKNSSVGLNVTKVPIAPEVTGFAQIHGLDPDDLALYGGEEYELVLTVKPEGWETAERSLTKIGSKLLPIGHVVDGREVTFERHGVRRPIALKGWEHFK